MTPAQRIEALDFGDYVSIEQHRYGTDNEMYLHKVIKTLKSNTYVDVPEVSGIKETHHDGLEDVVLCVCCGIDESRAFKYRVKDVKRLKEYGKSKDLEALLSQHKDMLEALRCAREWLSGWASAEPYITTIDDAIKRAEGKEQ